MKTWSPNTNTGLANAVGASLQSGVNTPSVELPAVGDTVLLQVNHYGGTQVVGEDGLSSGVNVLVLEVKEVKKTKVVFE